MCVHLLLWGGCGAIGRLQTPYCDVIHNFLHFLEVILESIKTLTESVVLEIEQSEARVQLSDKFGHADRASVVASGYGIHRQPRLLGTENVKK